tara:strand:+ start:794 stop:1216 length:423 start_codon:yes stop_codon:yes gene_type:complete
MQLKKTKISNCSIIDISKIKSDFGSLSIVENSKNIPFDVKRVYYLYNVPSGEERGGHAHKNLHQLIFALSGSFDIKINDSIKKKIISLNSPSKGLHIVPGIWRSLHNFSSGSICLVVASEGFLESDYIRNFKVFQQYKIL